MTDYFEGKVGIVTGAASGIGRAVATLLASRGSSVVIADIDQVGAEVVRDNIVAAGGTAMAARADVSQSRDVNALVSLARNNFGGLDWAHNNAGIEGRMGPLHEMTDDEFDRLIAVDLRSVFLCMKAEIIAFRQQGRGGAIVNTASTAALVGFPPTLSHYVAAKHGVAGMTKSVGLCYARENIRVNAVCPGLTDTAMLDRAIGGDPAIEEALMALGPMGRKSSPLEIAEVVAFLLSPASSYVNAQVIAIDGGLTNA